MWHLSTKGYANSTKAGRLHIFILGIKGLDHRNRNKLDCQKHNLRIAGGSQNNANIEKYKNNTSGFKGVAHSSNTGKWLWTAQVGVNGKLIHLGTFPLKVLAAKAYDKAAWKYFGPFACTNFPVQRFPRLK
jgi:hypothetical protein